jgi:hypothetical protein
MFSKTRIDKTVEIISSTPYPLTVDYSKSIEDLLMHYDGCIESGFTSAHFGHKGKNRGELSIQVELVHFGRLITCGDARRRLVQLGLRPATMTELLTFGIQYPDVQRSIFIGELGSTWRRMNGSRYIGYLRDIPLSVGLYWYNSELALIQHFLAVRE